MKSINNNESFTLKIININVEDTMKINCKDVEESTYRL